jgi:hypothetical protein
VHPAFLSGTDRATRCGFAAFIPSRDMMQFVNINVGFPW